MFSYSFQVSNHPLILGRCSHCSYHGLVSYNLILLKITYMTQQVCKLFSNGINSDVSVRCPVFSEALLVLNKISGIVMKANCSDHFEM
jgi:hypothetical protein